MSAPYSNYPKIVPVRESYILADLFSCKLDLEFVVFSLSQISGNFISRLSTDESFLKDYAFATSALIHYRRVLGSGVRIYKIEVSRFSANAERRKIHQHMIDLANKHVAHSVNSYEIHAAPIAVLIDHDTQIARFGGFRLGAAGYSFMSAQFRQAAIQHVNQLVADTLASDKAVLEEIISLKAMQMTSDQLKVLPEGFPPHTDDPDSTRSWPHRLGS